MNSVLFIIMDAISLMAVSAPLWLPVAYFFYSRSKKEVQQKPTQLRQGVIKA